MPERLTETLVRLGRLTPSQAEDALQRQVLLGGALDSSLFELQLVTESDLTDALSQSYGLPTATAEQISLPPDERASRAFPEQWAKKHMLAPLTFDEANGTLSVLSPAPADGNLIVRLGELLEIDLRPLLTPEFRVWQRLHLLFGSEPPERFQNLIHRHSEGGSVEPPPVEEPEPSDKRTWEPLTFSEAVQHLRDAQDRDAIVQIALRYAIRELEFVSVLINHDDALEGWAALGPGAERVPQLQLPLQADSAFRVVLDTHAHYLGPLPADAVHASFLEKIGRRPPRAVIIVPWQIRNRTVALLYGDNESNTIPSRMAADLMLFTTHVQMALENLLVRRKTETLSQMRRQGSGEYRAIRPDRSHSPVGELSSLQNMPTPAAGVDPVTPQSMPTPIGGIDPVTVPSHDARAPRAPSRPSVPVEARPPIPKPSPATPVDAAPPIESVASPQPAPPPVTERQTPPPVDHSVSTPEPEQNDVPNTPPISTPNVVPKEPSGDFDILPILPIGPEELLPDVLELAADTQPDPLDSPTAESEDLPISVDLQPAVSPELSEAWANDSATEPTEALPIPMPVLDDESSNPPEPADGDDWEPVQVSTSLGDELDRSIVEAQAALGQSELEPLELTAKNPSPALQPPVFAESESGPGLLQELDELTHSLESAIESAREPDPLVEDDGWESVAVNTWDEPSLNIPRPANFGAATPSGLEQMRASLTEDATVPDMSAEAWMRASSEVMRPRPLPPEIMERAALPEDSEPVPLTRITFGKNDPITEALAEESAWNDEDDTDEPVPLTRPRVHAEIPVADGPAETIRLAPVNAPPTAPDLDGYVDLLEDSDPSAYSKAAEALIRIGPPVLPTLSRRFPGRLDVDPFVQGTELPPFAHCGPVLSLLERFGRDAHPYVVQHLDSPEAHYRFFAIHFYGAVFVPEAIPRLMQRLHDEEPRICMLAARTLFSYREHAAFSAVLEHLHGRLRATSSSARRHAVYLIGLFRDVTAVPLLLEILSRKEKPLLDVTEDALAEITKQRLGTSARKWNNWWNKNQDRSRIVWLIDGLASKDEAVRKSADDELRAVTGLDMGYKDTAPKRQREEARQRWLKWWNENSRDVKSP